MSKKKKPIRIDLLAWDCNSCGNRYVKFVSECPNCVDNISLAEFGLPIWHASDGTSDGS